MPTIYEAQFRHARRFLDALGQISQDYRNRTIDPATPIKMLELKWGQIVKAFEWAYEARGQIEEAQDICLLFPIVGKDILYIWLNPAEFIRWLEISIDAIRDKKNYNNTICVSDRLGDIFSRFVRYPKESEMDLLLCIGISYKYLGKYDTALEYYENAYFIANKLGSTINKARILNSQALVYKQLGEYKKAKYYIEKAWKMAQKPGLEQLQALVAMDYGIIQFRLGNYEKALELYDLAEELSLRIGDASVLSKVRLNKAKVHEGMGRMDTAFKEYNDSLQTSIKRRDPHGEALAYQNIGIHYYVRELYQQSIEYQEKAVRIAHELGDSLTEGQAYLNICQSWGMLGDKIKAINSGQKAYLCLRSDKSKQSFDALETLNEWISEELSIDEQNNFWNGL